MGPAAPVIEFLLHIVEAGALIAIAVQLAFIVDALDRRK